MMHVRARCQQGDVPCEHRAACLLLSTALCSPCLSVCRLLPSCRSLAPCGDHSSPQYLKLLGPVCGSCSVVTVFCCTRPPLQKKNTLQFKALDNVLQTMNRETGVKEALSYRCADIDK